MSDIENSRLARCSVCGRIVGVVNSPNDPRWRYQYHNATGFRLGRECDNSGEVVDDQTLTEDSR